MEDQGLRVWDSVKGGGGKGFSVRRKGSGENGIGKCLFEAGDHQDKFKENERRLLRPQRQRLHGH